MKNSKAFLSIIMPCYNEEANLRRGVLREVAEYLSQQQYSWEVIISDDGSTDQSKKLIREFIQKNSGFKLIENPHQGKPFALKSGLNHTWGNYTLITDMDQSSPLNQVEKLLPQLRKGFEIVIGSRGGKRANFPLYRQLASSVFRFFRRLFILRELVDTQCGFKAFKTEVGKNVFAKMAIFKKISRAKGWRVTAYDVEFLFLAKKMGFKIAEVFIDWEDKNVARRKLSSFLKESNEMVKEIIRVKLNDIKGFYEKQ